MSTLLQEFKKLKENDSFYKQSENRVNQLVEKWTPTKLLEGFTEQEARNAALLYENQLNQILAQSTETGQSANSQAWSGVALPLVRKLLADIPSKQFMSIQPLDRPVGQVFYLDFKYGTTKEPFEKGGSIYGITENTDDPNGGFYGAGRFSYSINTHSAVIADTAIVVGAVAAKDIDFNAKLTTTDLKKVTITPSSDFQIDSHAVRSFAIQVTTGTDEAITNYYPAYTKFNTNGTISFIVKPGTDITLTNKDNGDDPDFVYKMFYSRTPANMYNRGDFEFRDTTPASQVIPELDVAFTNKLVAAKTRKLKAKWTPQSQQDMKALQNFDVETEIVNMLSEQITKEIDLELLDMLLASADTTEYWSCRPGFEYSKATNSFARNEAYMINDKSIWFRNLAIKINEVSNIIYQKTLRGQANFCVVSPRVSTIISSMNGFYSADDKKTIGSQKVGTLNDLIAVHKCPYITDNVILMGYKGNSYLETGAVYSPYVPLIQTPVVYDYDNFVPRKGIMTRYAKTITRKEFFGKIIIDGLETL